MSAQTKKRFGPFTYSAMLAAALAALYSGVEIAEPKVQEWLEHWRTLSALRSPDVLIRQQSVVTLGKQDPTTATAYLLEAINDPSVDVSLAACRWLADWDTDPRPLVPVLSAAATHQKFEVRAETARILSRILASAARRLSYLNDPRKGETAQARDRCVLLLYPLLKDPAEDVRAAAAAALGELRDDTRAAAELVAASSDKDRSVRLQVARSLLRINGDTDPTAARLLAALVADPEPVGNRSEVVQVLMEAAEENRNQALNAIQGLLSSDNPEVLPDVLACLGDAGPRARAVLPALEKLLHHSDPATRAAALTAMMKIEPSGSSSFTTVMLEMIANKAQVAESRMEALSRIHEVNPAALARVTPTLIRQLGDNDAGVRRVALQLLSEIIGDTPAQMPDHSNVP